MKITSETIYNAICKNGVVKVTDLARQYNLSASTVRRKLDELEKDGLITRTHGGVKSVEDDLTVTSFATRVHTNVAEKRRIALKAIKLIREGDVIFLDASSTTYFLTEYLNEFSKIKVITNGIDTLAALAAKGISAYSTGGKVSRESPSVLVGQFARNAVYGVHADVAFFSVHGINENGEIFDTNQSCNEITSCMIKCSDKVVCLCDNTKIGKSGAFKVCDVSDVDYVVCDRDVSGSFDLPENVQLIC
ncbi:MAG: DeoR/GlpR family DNA-binding transcription regulator [Clostridia bacterium]|nr:DeoR/GlpR family DNA-binding transcription regulator [Clostridia bacterium]MDY2714769.1 DeoR/GlpR family DNA-binding transcription regulator [Christensenellaceae bacterium]